MSDHINFKNTINKTQLILDIMMVEGERERERERNKLYHLSHAHKMRYKMKLMRSSCSYVRLLHLQRSNNLSFKLGTLGHPQPLCKLGFPFHAFERLSTLTYLHFINNFFYKYVYFLHLILIT